MYFYSVVNDVQMVKDLKGKLINIIIGCIYNSVCSSLVALFLRQQVTNLAAVMAHCGISPSRYGSLLKSGLFLNSNMSLIWSYIWQEVRKCSSVSTSFCGQCAHSLSSLESQVCLYRPFSISRLCLLSQSFP